ncbi:MAG: hypothetical protein IPH55_17025 [Betaproteobacteria bacterium]|nr:hypothetical protein [Betaproteobacteria bacterium]
MAYPTLPLQRTSKPIRRDGRDEQRAVGGTTYVRNFYTADKVDWELRHKALTASELATLEAHYAANATATFDFYWPLDGVTYTGLRYGAGALQYEPSEVPNCTDVIVRLVAA